MAKTTQTPRSPHNGKRYFDNLVRSDWTVTRMVLTMDGNYVERQYVFTDVTQVEACRMADESKANTDQKVLSFFAKKNVAPRLFNPAMP